MPKITRKRVVLAAVGLACLGAVALAAFFGLFVWSLNHRGSTSIDDLEVSHDRASSFTEFPIYWLGDRYAGYPLANVHVQSIGAGAGNKVFISYGKCDFPPVEGGCSPPITIAIQPACHRLTERASINADRTRWTSDVVVEMWASGTSVPEALDDLTIANPTHFPTEGTLKESLRDIEEVRASCGADKLTS